MRTIHHILTAAWYAALAAYAADYLSWAFTERHVARRAGPAVVALTAAMWAAERRARR